MKKFIALALLLSLTLLAGCETAAGAGKGLACGVGSTAEGVGKDSYNFFGSIMAADQWIRKNLW